MDGKTCDAADIEALAKTAVEKLAAVLEELATVLKPLAAAAKVANAFLDSVLEATKRQQDANAGIQKEAGSV